MFADELKTLRRLGFRHVRFWKITCALRAKHDSGLTASPKLCIRSGDRSNDLERPWSTVQHRVSYSCCAQVCAIPFISEEYGLFSAGHNSPSSSGSMEPAFYRGDLLFLTNPAGQRYQTGDITVYKIPGADIPIVHRVMETHDAVSNKKGCVKSTELVSQYSDVLTIPTLSSVSVFLVF